MAEPATQSDIDSAVKDLQKKATLFLIIATVVASVMYFFWNQIAESVRNYDAVKRIPDLEKRVESLDKRLESLDTKTKINTEILDKVVPRVPAWETSIRRGGS